jgi:hypothetical protein
LAMSPTSLSLNLILHLSYSSCANFKPGHDNLTFYGLRHTFVTLGGLPVLAALRCSVCPGVSPERCWTFKRRERIWKRR